MRTLWKVGRAILWTRRKHTGELRILPPQSVDEKKSGIFFIHSPASQDRQGRLWIETVQTQSGRLSPAWRASNRPRLRYKRQPRRTTVLKPQNGSGPVPLSQRDRVTSPAFIAGTVRWPLAGNRGVNADTRTATPGLWVICRSLHMSGSRDE